MTKALIVKLGALESCSLAASADFGMIGGTDRQDGDPWDCVHVAIHTATGGAFGPPYLLFVASLYARVATGALSASPSIRSLAGYSLCADRSRGTAQESVWGFARETRTSEILTMKLSPCVPDPNLGPTWLARA